MVVSLDTQNNTGFMLSIPRDLWVNIPTLGHQKINAANDVTTFSASGYPSGGMGQLEQIVTSDLGIPIDYYALIDYSAFKDAVNAVGGITVNIQSPDPRGLYDPNTKLKLPNGEDALTGQVALNLARARGDGYGSYGFPQADFDRTQHQRQMLVAIGQKALSLGVLSNPVKVGQLFDALGNNVKTDLTLSDALRLVQLSKTINVNNLQSVTYSYSGANPLLQNYNAPDGEDALIPTLGIDDFSQLQQYYKQLTSTNPLVEEGASIVILNSTSQNGLALSEEKSLDNQGFNVVSIGDAKNQYPDSMIVDNSNNQDPTTKKDLTQLFPSSTTAFVSINADSAEAKEAAPYSADFVIILGQNAATPSTGSATSSTTSNGSLFQ
jgi:polyisoprenyl-teichoic acid--peptidoglycan teichoic acid transferase